MSAESVTDSNSEVPAAPEADQDILLRADRVTRRFGGLVAVRDVDLVIPRGGIVSIIGPNGAGKTTFFNVIAGIIDPTAGTVVVPRAGRSSPGPAGPGSSPSCGSSRRCRPARRHAARRVEQRGWPGDHRSRGRGLRCVTILVAALARPPWYRRFLGRFGVFRSARPNDVVASGVGRTFQNIRLFQNMTALENVLVGHAPPASREPRRPRDLEPAPEPRGSGRRRRRRELLRLVGLRGREGELAKNLPYGDQRRLEIARALGNDPQLLLLDEPTAGHEPDARRPR